MELGNYELDVYISLCVASDRAEINSNSCVLFPQELSGNKIDMCNLLTASLMSGTEESEMNTY